MKLGIMKYKQRPIYRNLFLTVTIILQVEKLENLFACLRNPKCSLSQSFAKACELMRNRLCRYFLRLRMSISINLVGFVYLIRRDVKIITSVFP